MIGAHFILTLDTTPPVTPSMLVDAGADRTGSPMVRVTLMSASTDVYQQKVWGDVDPTYDTAIGLTEADSVWTTYGPYPVPLRLSDPPGRKYLYARLRDDVGNETPAFTDWIDYDTSVPVISISTGPTRTRISKVASFNACTFGWTSSVVFDRYEIKVVPTPSSPRVAGVLIGTASGSINVAATRTLPPFPADVVTETTLTGTDVQSASPGDSGKVIKVFVRGATSGQWSA